MPKLERYWMTIEVTNYFPVVLLGVMITLTLILLPRLDDETRRRRRDDDDKS